jgi:hypothetical protein
VRDVFTPLPLGQRPADMHRPQLAPHRTGPGRRRAPSHSRQGHPGSELASDAPYDARLPAAAASPHLAGGDAEELLPHFCDRGFGKGIIPTKPPKPFIFWISPNLLCFSIFSEIEVLFSKF